jgi:hypothetical protein
LWGGGRQYTSKELIFAMSLRTNNHNLETNLRDSFDIEVIAHIICAESYNLHSTSLSIIKIIKSREMKCKLHVACVGGVRNAWKSLGGKPERKRLLGAPRN